MALAYVPPGVTVDEVDNPTFSPFTIDPTSICIIGPGRGFENHTEILLLEDNAPVTLAVDGVTFTPTVTDASDPLGTPFSAGTDYVFDGVNSTITRAMQTGIDNGEEVVVYYTDASTAYTEWPTLINTAGYAPVNRSVTVTRDNIYVQKEGVIPAGDYVITPGAGAADHQIKLSGSPTVLAPASKQRVYVYWTGTDTLTHNVLLTLNSTTNVTITGSGGSNAGSIVVRNAAGSGTDAAVRYTRAGNAGLTDQDFAVLGLTGSGSGATAEAATISRSVGSTTMGVGADALQVRVVYQATPTDYYLPTRCFSQSDVESKFGPALDSSGNISSPISLASSLAFANGTSDLVVQALYHVNTNGTLSPGGTNSNVSVNLQDWNDTLEALRDIEDINVLVPIVSAAGGATTDGHTLTVFQAFGSHVNYMAQQNQLLIVLAGEDGTATGNIADKTVLQNHAVSLQNQLHSESFTLVSPSSFAFANPVTGASFNVGGQYIAACLAGMLAGRGVQETLTHKQLSTIIAVNDFRSEMDKNDDAASGLLVVENRRGIIRVRHAITVDVGDINNRELSVVRAKQFIVENILSNLEDQVIGNTVADGNAPLTVETAVINMLETMISQGALVTYQDIQARQTTADPTRIEVRFSYLPAYPLNYIDVVFSINTAGNVLTNDSQGV